MLLHPILHDLGAVANFTEMAVYPFNHGSVRMSQLLGNRVNAHRSSLIECLQPRARVRVAKRLRPNLAHLRAPALRPLYEVELPGVRRDAIDEGADLIQYCLPCHSARRRGKQEAPRRCARAEDIGPENLLSLRPE